MSIKFTLTELYGEIKNPVLLRRIFVIFKCIVLFIILYSFVSHAVYFFVGPDADNDDFHTFFGTL